ncbi:MAG: heavy metal translocating P-type ATPase, partial [Acidimicrobiales bacterium]
MSCSFCVNTIKKAYMRIDGVEEVGVSLAHEEGLVRFDPTRVSADELIQTLRDIGYVPRDPDKVRSYEEDEAELRTARLHLYGAAALSVASVVIMAVGKWFDWVTIPAMSWILFAFALITMFGFGWYIKKQAFSTLRIGILNQHNLLEFGAFGGLVGGILGLLGNSAFPAGEFFAVSTFITTYHILSGYVSLRLRVRSSQAVRRLLELAPDTARVIRDGEEFEIPLEEVVVGDKVRIRPGESVPVDGVISEGVSAIDEAIVTGESIPTEKTAGDEVIGGSINQNGTLVVTVTRVGDESFLAQVANSIEEARSLRPGALQLVDVVLKYYVPGVLGFAGFAFALWMVGPLLIGGSPDPTRAVSATLAVLVMGYPCALGMATPLAMIRGGGMAAERGILMRSGEAFQVMQELDTVVFDKTGTITKGETVVTAVHTVQGTGTSEMLRFAASVEAASEHPLARAIEKEAVSRGLQLEVPEDFSAKPGRGVQGTIDDRHVLVAKIPHLVDQAIDVETALSASDESIASIVDRLELSGQTVVGVAADGALLGVIGISDTIKSDAAQTVRQLSDSGVRSVMITGDNERTARAVAGQVGIDTVIAGVLPSEKADHIRRLQQDNGRV